MADFVREHRSQLVFIRQTEQRRRYVNVAAGKRKGVNLLALNDVKLVEQAWPQAGFRAALADALRPIKARVREIELLRYFAMELRAEFDLVAFVQQARVRITRIAKVRVGIVKLDGERLPAQRIVSRCAVHGER